MLAKGKNALVDTQPLGGTPQISKGEKVCRTFKKNHFSLLHTAEKNCIGFHTIRLALQKINISPFHSGFSYN